MMIIKLYGGLGNQLFQWAFGLGLSTARQTTLKFDVSSFEEDSLRNFELDKIINPIHIASSEEITKHRKESNFISLCRRKVNSVLKPYYLRDIVCEQTYLFDKNLFENSNPNGFYEGYWQNAHYFEHVRAEIIQSIDFPANDRPEFLSLKSYFSSHNITSVHIRRGDFAAEPELLKIHGLCSVDYYQSAIKTILEKDPNTEFRVFSDDIDWCKKHLSSSANLVYIDETSSMFEDLELMTLSTNNITANSSFSWWGAWLNQTKSKIVISPKKWFDQSPINYSEIVPKTWIKL